MKHVFALLFLILALHNRAFAADDAILFGVNEGTSGSTDFMERQEKYKGLAEYLSNALKTPVRLESAQDLKSLTNNLKTARYGLLLVRPSHISAKAMRDQKYTLVASASGDAATYFIVPNGSPLKAPADLKGKRIAMPDQLAYPTRVGLAMLRDVGLPPEKQQIQYFRTQEAVGYAVEKNLVDAGVIVSYSKVAKEWIKNGHAIMWQSKKLPFWSVIASPKMSPQTVESVRAALIKLNGTPQGDKILSNIGVKNFVAGDQQSYLDLLAWVRD